MSDRVDKVVGQVMRLIPTHQSAAAFLASGGFEKLLRELSESGPVAVLPGGDVVGMKAFSCMENFRYQTFDGEMEPHWDVAEHYRPEADDG